MVSLARCRAFVHDASLMVTPVSVRPSELSHSISLKGTLAQSQSLITIKLCPDILDSSFKAPLDKPAFLTSKFRHLLTHTAIDELVLVSGVGFPANLEAETNGPTATPPKRLPSLRL